MFDVRPFDLRQNDRLPRAHVIGVELRVGGGDGLPLVALPYLATAIVQSESPFLTVYFDPLADDEPLAGRADELLILRDGAEFAGAA
jgi:hypothetical protein